MTEPYATGPPGATAPSGWRTRLRWLILVSGMIGLAVVTRQALTADESAVPSSAAAVVACVLHALSGMAAARAWAVLLGPDVDQTQVRGAMYESQLSKYVPAGGLLQAAGQVALSTSTSVTMRRSAFAWVTSIIVTVVAGCLLLSAFALAGGFTGWGRAAAALAAVSIVALDRRVLSWVLVQARRVSARVPRPDSLPAPAVLRSALLWATAGFLLVATSFTTILLDLDGSLRAVDVLPAFVAGWLVGFLLVPLPAGLGAREAVLVALIPGSTTGLILAASLGQRVVAFAAELAVVVGHRAAKRRSTSRR